MSTIRMYLASVILLCLSASASLASDSTTIAWNLSALRGGWRYMDFNEPTTVTFVSDSLLLLNGKEVTYSLLPQKIRVYGDNGSTDYGYAVEGDRLTTDFPSGREVPFTKVAPGNAESLLSGDYYFSSDTNVADQVLSFDGENGFVSYSGSTRTGKGLYRIGGDSVLFVTSGGVIDHAEIRSEEENGLITGLVYGGNIFEKSQPSYGDENDTPGGDVMTAAPLPVIIVASPPAYLPVGGPVVSPPTSPKTDPPKREIGSTRGSTSASPTTSTNADSPKRDMGTTRPDTSPSNPPPARPDDQKRPAGR